MCGGEEGPVPIDGLCTVRLILSTDNIHTIQNLIKGKSTNL